MSTKSEQFSNKIRNLTDYQNRVINNAVPLPNGTDIANTLKYFSHTLGNILENAAEECSGMKPTSTRRRVNMRLSNYPSLDYNQFYETLVGLIDIVEKIEFGQNMLGSGIISLFGTTMWFVDPETVDTIPHTVASTLAIFPQDLQRTTVDLLTNTLIPVCLTEVQNIGEENYASMSMVTVVMLVLEHCKNPALHAKVIECIMTYKKDVFKDMMCTIAHGPSKARAHAANLLFNYWPALAPSRVDHREFAYTAWEPIMCQRKSCLIPNNNAAVKMCMDYGVAGKYSKIPYPPVYLCADCCELVARETHKSLIPVLNPREIVAKECENKNCQSSDKSVIFVCFSPACTSLHSHLPMSYCKACFAYNHKEAPNHIYQEFPEDPWAREKEMQAYFTEAIISLLKEAQPVDDDLKASGNSDNTHDDKYSHTHDNDVHESKLNLDDPRMLSRFGIWLLVEKCQPSEKTSPEVIGRLLNMLFQWYYYTSKVPDDDVGNCIEKLKTEYVSSWLSNVRSNCFSVFVSCLLPQPPQYARVGGHWDTLCSKTSEIDQGLQVIFSLTLYNCVTYEVWDSIMPLWMEAIQKNISYDDLSQLQDILCKLFSTDIPLPFSTDKVFHFISSKFKGPSSAQMLEALQWLQILCELDISLPFDLLVLMFNDGIAWMKGPNAKQQQQRKRCPSHPSTGSLQSPKSETPEVTVDSPTLLSLQDNVFLEAEEDVNLQCFVVMLDLILRKYDSQGYQSSLGLEHKESKETLSVIMSMLQAPWGGAHCCTVGDETQECSLCDLSALWFQLALLIIETIASENEVKITDMPEVSEYDFDTKIKRLVQLQKDCPQKEKYQPTVEIPEKSKPKKLGQQLKAQSFDLGQVQSITRTGKALQSDSRQYPTRATAPRLHKVSENSFNDDQTGEGDGFVHLQEQSVWNTSYGEVHFKMSDLPLHLQILSALVKELPKHDDSVVLHYLISCIRIVCLNEESLRGAVKDNIAFLVYAQEQLLIPNMWRLMQGEQSHLVSLMVPIMHHCLALPCGADALWRIVDSDVRSEDWQFRFRGVESIGAFLRFADNRTIGTNSVIMSTLAHLFSSLIGCAEDVCPAVATRTVVMLETIPATALKVLIHCLEFQWDSVLEDRALILSRFHQLKYFLPGATFFTWEFFMNRLDTLSVEAQVDLDQNREFPFPVADKRDTSNPKQQSTDLSRSRTVSGEKTEKPNQTKLHRAMIIRTQSDTPQSKLRHQMMPSTSGSTKRCYPRSESAPTNLWAFRRGVFRSSERSTYSNQSSPDNLLSLGSLVEEVFEDGHLGPLEEEQGPPTTESQTNPLDLAFIDKETVHQLITLLMRFMAKAECSDDDQNGSVQAMNTVIRHLHALLGFSKTDRLFTIAPHQLRESSVFNAFIAGIAKVVDYNIKLGSKILPLVVELLKYCPSPQKTPHHRQHQDYTLFFLEPHCRQSWLMTILVILYKYDIDSSDLKDTLAVLIKICINTIEGHVHICKPKLPEPPQPEDIWGATSDVLDPPKSEPTDMGFDSNSKKAFSPGGAPLHTSTPNKESLSNSGGQTVKQTVLYLSDDQSSRVVPGNIVSTIVEEEETAETVEMLEPIAEANLETATARVMFVEKEEDLVVTSKPCVIEEEPVIEKQITDPSSEEKQKIPYTVRNRRKRKKAIVNIATTTPDAHRKGTNQRSRGKRFHKKSETLRGSERRSSVHSAVRRYNEDKNIMALNRCSDCNAILEEYDEDTISLAIVVLATYIHKDLDLAARFLLEVLQVVARVASATFYPWQNDIIGSPPGHVCSVAKQFLRCICHQLAPNGVFVTLFLSRIEDHTFLKTLALALDDFGELSAMDAVHRLLEGLNRKSNLPPLRIQRAVLNLADYMEELPLESGGAWSSLIVHFDIFFKKLIAVLPENCDVSPLFRIMLVLLKCPAVKNLTALLDSFSKIISFTIQKARFKIRQLMELCSLAYRTFTKDRERLSLSRCVVIELNNALKFKISIPDANLIELVQFVCIDAGGRISETFFDEAEMKQLQASWCSTGVLECMRSYMNDCIEFIGDLHTLAKVKSNMRGGSQNLNEDTLGSQLKAGVAQIIALEFTRTSHRDNRTVNRYLPWLYHPPSTMQQGPKEFVDSIAHVRLLSWLLLGSLTHSAMCPTFSYSNSITSLPISLDASSHIAEHVQVILACFAEQSSTSLLHMSSLTHAFILCQLWTMYCEQFAMMSYPHSEQHNTAILGIMDFWGRVTPGVLQLLSHSKVDARMQLAERVNMHFLSLMEALLECHSSALPKLLPMWSPILFSYHSKLPGSTQVRLQTILNNPPPSLTKGEVNNFNCNIRICWLKGLQFKMGQIEVQWSNASQYLAV